MLQSSTKPLVEAYDLGMFDLDGVVYLGDEPVAGAADALARARDLGWPCAFVTNNASRPPQAVVDKLAGVGVEAQADDVVTSAQAAARLLREAHGEGATIACLGSDGLVEALRDAGLRPVAVDDDAVGIVSGYGPEVEWRDIMHAAVLVRDGLPWVASNRDLTIPTPWGSAPGHGVLVGLSADLAGLFEPHPAPERDDGGWVCGGWTATVEDGSLGVAGDGGVDDWWRVVASASWAHLDESGDVVDTADVAPPDSGPRG